MNKPKQEPLAGRRQLLAGSATALVAAGLGSFTQAARAQVAAPTAAPALKPFPPYVSWKDANAMILHATLKHVDPGKVAQIRPQHEPNRSERGGGHRNR
ncbi:MAG: hypothetical protein K2W93_13420, partial [Burkholderiaceae bacterium]|nr:hypothetical protein [Burkholderiaceae bacterium]